MPEEFITVSVSPEVAVLGGGSRPSPELALLRQWIERNREVLVQFWEGQIEYTEDVLNRILPV
jgi:hypothetical protein